MTSRVRSVRRFCTAVAWLAAAMPAALAGCKPGKSAAPAPAAAPATESPGQSTRADPRRGTSNQTRADSPAPQLVDVAAQLGIKFEYFRGETGQFWPVEPVGGGAAWIDYDGDGWLDLLLVGGTQLPVEPDRRFFATRLFRNLQGERFHDVTEAAGLRVHDYGQGCAVADYDNDGDPDLFLTNYGTCALYHNNNDGTFTEVTEYAGVPGGAWNTGACFTDLDRDGTLDLYVAGYFHFTRENYQPCRSSKGSPEYCGPSDSPALPDFLYRGLGDGTFENVSNALGIAGSAGPGFGAVSADLDNDGWPELYVANDAWANFLFHNRTGCGRGTIELEESAHEWGAAVNADGVPQASMGLACADFDNNGFLDLAVTNFTYEYTTLYENQGDQFLVDSSQRLGLAAASHTTMGWGLVVLDYDQDGWPDLFVGNGHINRSEFGSQPYEMTAHLFHNDGGKRFTEMSRQSGGYFEQPVIARGVALGDFDNDGDSDIAVVHHHRPASLLRNATETSGRAITLELIGTVSQRDAINARVQFWIEPQAPAGAAITRVRELVSGDSYLSSNERKICVGVGAGNSRVRAEIRWPSGLVQPLDSLEAGERRRIFEPSGPAAASDRAAAGD